MFSKRFKSQKTLLEKYAVIVDQASEHDNYRAPVLKYHLPEILIRVRKWTLCSNKPRNVSRGTSLHKESTLKGHLEAISLKVQKKKKTNTT